MAKISIWEGDDRTIDPGVFGVVAFLKFRIYYRQLKQEDILGLLTISYIFYFVWVFDCDHVSTPLRSTCRVGRVTF